MKPVDPRTPVIVGVAQSVDRESEPASAPSPLDSLEAVARAAEVDSGAVGGVLGAIDWLLVIRTFADSGPDYRLPGWNYPNLPRSLARRIGAQPDRAIYPAGGGNTPQWAINLFADAIAKGEADVCLLAGAENTRTAARAQRQGVTLDWTDDPGGEDAEVWGKVPRGNTKTEARHGISLAATGYAMFENALGHHYGRSPKAHRRAIGRLMAAFSEKAASNPYSMSQSARSVDDIVDPRPDNRYLAYPYTKYLCSNMYVDQAAAVLMMSEATADRLGIARAKRVYLHGAADTTEKWLMSERVNFWSAPAIAAGAAAAVQQAGISFDDLAFIDLYSCFASPVQVAADSMGISHDDMRGLTVTGGLPYFGGPGSNYATHAIAEMAQRLRGRPGAFGLTYANGLFLTKHAFGVYSSAPPEDGYRKTDPATYQSAVDALDSPAFDDSPSGIGEIETFTVIYEGGVPTVAPVFGRFESGARFVANIVDPAALEAMIDKPVIGRRIAVTAGERVNVATFA